MHTLWQGHQVSTQMLLRASVLEGIPGFNYSCDKAQTVKENLIKEVLISEKIG